jgi:hypothetical protein
MRRWSVAVVLNARAKVDPRARVRLWVSLNFHDVVVDPHHGTEAPMRHSTTILARLREIIRTAILAIRFLQKAADVLESWR